MIWWLVFTAVNLLVIVNNMSVPTLSKPTFMESGIHTIFVNTLTSSGTGITITFGSPFAVGTMPKAAVIDILSRSVYVLFNLHQHPLSIGTLELSQNRIVIYF